MFSSSKYEALPQDSLKDEERDLITDRASVQRKQGFNALFVAVFILSNVCTWFLSRGFPAYTAPNDSSNVRTPYAALELDTEAVFGGHDLYTDQNDTFRDELWQAINIDDGMIALPDDFVRDTGLPVSQRFPWDESKGIYLLHGHHNLHCVRSVYISLMEYRKGLPQTRNFRHVIHCLDALRRDVICNADDTPRFTTDDDVPETGHNQPRKCRSWDKLEQWAAQYNACYRYINETLTPSEFPQIQRFVWCREGSPYKAEVEKYFNVEWNQPAPKVPQLD